MISMQPCSTVDNIGFQGKGDNDDEEDDDLQLGADKVLLTCVGANFKNVGYATK